jgi:CheY-like chemotaxis protein
MSSSSPNRLVVLVVEDEPIVRFDAIQSLEDAGFEVVDAYDADHALVALEQRPDVRAVFTDVHMPGRLNGVELARLVHQRRPDVQVLVTSGVMRVSRDDLPEGGHFVPKPYDASQVAALIRNLVEDETPATGVPPTI